MPSSSVKPRLRPLRLRPGYMALPPEAHARLIGEALVKSLYVSNGQHRSLDLERISDGSFVGRACARTIYKPAWREQRGSLIAALEASPSDAPSWSERLYLGFPALGAETATAGALLIRLFGAAERADAYAAFEYTPWAQPHLRYRLRYAITTPGGSDEFRFLHGPTALDLLARAAAFFSAAAR